VAPRPLKRVAIFLRDIRLAPISEGEKEELRKIVKQGINVKIFFENQYEGRKMGFEVVNHCADLT